MLTIYVNVAHSTIDDRYVDHLCTFFPQHYIRYDVYVKLRSMYSCYLCELMNHGVLLNRHRWQQGVLPQHGSETPVYVRVAHQTGNTGSLSRSPLRWWWLMSERIPCYSQQLLLFCCFAGDIWLSPETADAEWNLQLVHQDLCVFPAECGDLEGMFIQRFINGSEGEFRAIDHID